VSRRHRRITNTVAVILVCLGLGAAPPARAITPPVIDSTRLPAPSPPAPPQPTTQLAACTATPRTHPGPDANPLRRLALEAAWQLSHGEGQRIAVIDTGVARHGRLANVEAAGDYVSAGDGTQDCDGHGTVVAGIISAAADPEDPTHFAGVAPAATLLAIRQSTNKFGPADEPGRAGFGDVDTMASAVRTAADLGATVINISSVACGTGQLDDGRLGAALAYAVDVKDAVVVTAAGNAGGAGQCPRQSASPEMTWDSATVAVSPAWYDDYVLTVGSVDGTGAPSSFSLAGPWVDVAAPGENMVSLNPGGSGLTDALPALGRSMPLSGTSYAAPVVSGLAALIRARFPTLTARQVMQRIEATAHGSHSGWDPVVGNGVVDPVAALDPAAERPAPPPESSKHSVAGPPPGRARTIAVMGAGVCGAVLAAAMAMLSLAARLRRRDHALADSGAAGSVNPLR
jgi:membrane-anchored mycosin MYCP